MVVNLKFVNVPDPELLFAAIVKACIGTFIDDTQILAEATGVVGFPRVKIVGARAKLFPGANPERKINILRKSVKSLSLSVEVSKANK